MKVRLLFIVTAVVESLAGLASIFFPSIAVEFLIGSPLSSPAGLFMARIAGAALIALSVACWMSRNNEQSIAVKGLLTGMLLYNILTSLILAYVAFSLQLSLVLLLAIILHLALTAWCMFVLQYVGRNKRI